MKDKEIQLCEYCCKRPALKTNGESKYECENHANSGSCEGLKPVKYLEKLQHNNDRCNCGSGLKYKKCCKNKTGGQN